ncbi:unnamed protein product [Peniophora sp. CBMAI 1063]|nr:unnamed protein product [Peniophora sp. CBMAI 1063]
MRVSFMLSSWPFSSLFSTVILFVSLASFSHAQQTFFPASVPLAVRSTYFNTWKSTTNTSVWSRTWPSLSVNPSTVLGWAGMVRIDGISYVWLGDMQNAQPTTVKNVNITATRSIFTLEAGPMELTVSFLSPIEPGDFVRQSMPFSYVSFEARALDDQSHAVEVYSDISGEWSSGDRSHAISWTTDSTGGMVHHSITLSQQQTFVDISEQAEWGTMHYAALSDSSTTYRTGVDASCRGLFNDTGKLDNAQDTNFRAIDDQFPVFAVAQDLGDITATSEPVVWAIGYTRDPAVQTSSITGTIGQRSLYFQSNITDMATVVSSFLSDYTAATQRASALDDKLASAAADIGSGTTYADLVAYVPRQVYGATELTVGLGFDGKLNVSDVMMFMRDNGGQQAQRTQPVEVLYAAWPMFMVIDPSLGGPLLEPLLSAQDTPAYLLPYAMTDLGTTYPNVTARNNPHDQGVEQSANMLIMTFAHARVSGDGSLLGRHYSLLCKWADYLVNNTLELPSEFSTDNLSLTKQSNLAIKGIIAIQAMSGISQVLGVNDDASKYSVAAKDLFTQWKSQGVGSDGHMLAAYSQQSTWSLGYNLFADKFLETNVVDEDVYSGQSSALQKLMSTTPATTSFGIPVDSLDIGTVVSSWNLFTAAIVQDSVRDDMITRIHSRTSFNGSSGAFPLTYDSSKGTTVSGIASPAQGAMYAPIALNLKAQAIQNASVLGATSAAGTSYAAAIAGGVVGALVGVAVIAGLSVFLYRRSRARRMGARESHPVLDLTASEKGLEAGQISSFNGSSMVRPANDDNSPPSPTPFRTDPMPSQSYASWTTYDPGAAPTTSSGSIRGEPPTREITPNLTPVDGPVAPLSEKEVLRRHMAQNSNDSQRSGFGPAASTASHDAGQLARALSITSASTDQTGTVTRRSSIDMYAFRLREEVDNLRQEMAAIRGRQPLPMPPSPNSDLEPPPSYS